MMRRVSGNFTTFEVINGWPCIGLIVTVSVKAIHMYCH